MDMQLYLTSTWARGYLSMLRLKLINFSKKDPSCIASVYAT